MNGKGLIGISDDILNIHQTFRKYLNHPNEHDGDEFEIFIFSQTWPNIGCGLDEGLTGQMICGGFVYVFLPEAVEDEDIHVFFDGRWAYKVPYESTKRAAFVEDVLNQQVAGVSEARIRYGAITLR